MLVKLLSFGLLLLSFSSNSIEYDFDYKLTYENENLKNPKLNCTIIQLINKKDNSYSITSTTVSGKNRILNLLDQKGLLWKGKVPTQNITNQVVYLDNKLMKSYANSFKYQVDNYDFIALKDTLLNNKTYKRFILKSNDIKREQKLKLGREVYVIDINSNIEPVLTFPTAYEIWKKRKNIPNGIIVEKYLYNSKGEMESIERLINTEEINTKYKILVD